MMQISIRGESKLIRGHVLDVSLPLLMGQLKRYDEQLYLKWSASKQRGLGVWELRRKPELKSIREGYCLDVPNKGTVCFPGDVYDMGEYTITVPKYHETREDCVKTFERLDYRILDWVANQDLWKYGYKGKDFIKESEYREAKYEEKIDQESYAEKAYGFKQIKTQIRDFQQYVLDGGDPYRIIDYWK